MSESVNRLKANLKLQGQACGHCSVPLALGEDAAVCAACTTPHHGRCWDTSGGCSRAGCQNAPLQQLAPQVQAPTSRPGFRPCPNCRAEITLAEQLCPYCNAITSADGVYRGPKENAPGAVASLVYSLVGLLICGIIFGPIAIAKSRQAKEAIASNPRYTGHGLATAGMIIGIIEIILFFVFLLIRAGNM